MPEFARRAAGWWLPLTLALVAVLPWVAAWGDLPDPMATHWDTSGRPDGHSPPLLAATLTAGPAVVAAAVLAAALRTARRRSSPPRPAPPAPGRPQAIPHSALAAVVAAAVGGQFCALSYVLTWANAGASSWEQADAALGWILLVTVAGMALPVLAVARAVRAGAAEAPAPGAGSDGGAKPRAASERVAWVGECHARWPYPVAAVLVVAAAIGAAVSLWLTALLALVAIAVTAFGSVHVSVGVRGVRVATSTGWPRVRVPLRRIATARAVDLAPLRWGGWGYRGSLTVVGRAAWVLRYGPALELTMADGRVFAVTVDGASEAAAAVTELLRSPAEPAA
jgi:hypothetical protein